MGRILKHDFFEIYIFSNDHAPPHFHVYIPNKRNVKGQVKLGIPKLEVLELEGISQKDLKRIIAFLTAQRVEILEEEWRNFHE